MQLLEKIYLNVLTILSPIILKNFQMLMYSFLLNLGLRLKE